VVERTHSTWFHFVKQPRYFSAVDEVREPQTGTTHARRKDGSAPPKNAAGLEAGVRKGYFTETFENPLGKLPGSVWTDLSWDQVVERIVKGWAPREICSVCGEGRRPVVASQITKATPRPLIASAAPGNKEQHKHNWIGNKHVHGTTEATITGYTCACPEPTAPSTPPSILIQGTDSLPLGVRT
jgi:hypothetical protein